VRFTKPVKIPDGQGGYEVTEPEDSRSLVATLWARVEPLSGRELARYQTVYSQVSTKINIRYHPNVDAKCTGWIGSREFGIEAVINVEEANKEMDVLAYERS